jgi:biotin carboxyl carrier protein
MPGTVVRVDVAAGDTVEAGTALVTIEAMKMEHAVRSPARGTVTAVSVAVGAQVDGGTVLAVVEEEPP